MIPTGSTSQLLSNVPSSVQAPLTPLTAHRRARVGQLTVWRRIGLSTAGEDSRRASAEPPLKTQPGAEVVSTPSGEDGHAAEVASLHHPSVIQKSRSASQ